MSQSSSHRTTTTTAPNATTTGEKEVNNNNTSQQQQQEQQNFPLQTNDIPNDLPTALEQIKQLQAKRDNLLAQKAKNDKAIEQLTKKIAENGGKQRTKVWELIPDKPYKIAYCEDPFGNIIEIYTHSYQEVWGDNQSNK